MPFETHYNVKQAQIHLFSPICEIFFFLKNITSEIDNLQMTEGSEKTHFGPSVFQ